MTRDEFTAIARSALDKFNPADIDKDIALTSLDSLDLLMLRAALETHLGHSIRDEDWFSSRSLGALLRAM